MKAIIYLPGEILAKLELFSDNTITLLAHCPYGLHLNNLPCNMKLVKERRATSMLFSLYNGNGIIPVKV